MAWLEIHQALPNHRKTLNAADALDISPVHMMGHLITFWLWALDNAPSGRLDGISSRVIARAAQWEGDSEIFFKALVDAGWIDKKEDGYEIHDWSEYAGKLIQRREEEKEYKKRQHALYGDMRLIKAVRERDGDYCRYCGKTVNWKDRKGADGGTYDHIDPDGDNSVENIVVACRACNSKKGGRTPEQAGMVLLPPKTEAGRFQVDIQQIYGKKNLQLHYSTVHNSTDSVNNIPPPDGEGSMLQDNQHQEKRQEAKECAKTASTNGECAKTALDVAQTAGKAQKQEYTSEFEEFWSIYPRKVEKKTAFSRWCTNIKANISAKDMIQAARNYAAYCRAECTEERYIKHPSTFLAPKNKPFTEWINKNLEGGTQNVTTGGNWQHTEKTKSTMADKPNRFAGLARDAGSGKPIG